MEILLNNNADLNNYLKEKNMTTFEYICTFGSNEMIELIKKYKKWHIKKSAHKTNRFVGGHHKLKVLKPN